MDKILNWFTEKITFIISLVGVGGFLLSLFLHKAGICAPIDIYSYETDCGFAAVVGAIFCAIIFFAVMFLIYKNELVFIAWKEFTFIYLFFYIFIVIITPWYEGDGFLSIQKDLIALALVGLYVAISIGLVLLKSIKKIPTKL